MGMLVFGLTVIFLFIRLHGEGYDFPLKVAVCEGDFNLPSLPDRTYMEITGVYHDHFRDLDTGTYSNSMLKDLENNNNSNDGHVNVKQDRANKDDHRHKFVVGWNAQWHIGKKNRRNEGTASNADDEIEYDSKQQDLIYEYRVSKEWIWLTAIWHEDGDCGPGVLRQYRRRLDHVLRSNNATRWELMYTHRFPGPITHSSLSKRIVPQESESRESIRLAVVYKVVQDEHVAYHSRVYHFGVFHRHLELRECTSASTETCHAQHPFVSFDYVLPGSTPIKDFSLEHNMILYSRFSDKARFRALKLPQLKAGSTSFERPFALSYGVPGPSLICDERRSVPYRTSYLTRVPSESESEAHVLMGQVQDYGDSWQYLVSIATEEITDGSKRWSTTEHRRVERRSLVQENDMINDETHTYGESLQKPFVVKSADESSINIPIKNLIFSLETISLLDQGVENTELFSQEEENNHGYSDSASNLLINERTEIKTLDGDYTLLPGSSLQKSWVNSSITVGSLDSIDTEAGALNDATDIMVLKTTHNGLLILRRSIVKTEFGRRLVSKWELSMAMDDIGYNPISKQPDTKVLAMKVLTVPASAHDSEDPQGPPLSHFKHAEEPLYSPSTPLRTESGRDKVSNRNILLLVYGSGRIFGYDLDHPDESSPLITFLSERYPAVIGMLAVVIAFVINEAR
ncbi:hypothetical protein BGX28_004706 [Mortierella sp. GBA30]|nr:hypothetical protein BGX28_004706 [Mortierella sp. GBA30]